MKTDLAILQVKAHHPGGVIEKRLTITIPETRSRHELRCSFSLAADQLMHQVREQLLDILCEQAEAEV